MLILFAAVLLNLSCGAPVSNEFTAEQQQQVLAAAQEVMRTYNISAAIVGVWEEGKSQPLIVAVGTAELSTGRAVQATDHFRIASITKTFTGMVILQLIDEGKISFEATLDRYCPQVTNASSITIRQLLGMTAGIYDYSNNPDFANVYFNDLTKYWSRSEITALFNGKPQDFAPGTDCKYSNTNFYLLGMIIEQVTGSSAEAEIKTRIIDRLGLTNTSFPTDTSMPATYCHGYSNLTTTGEGTLNDVSISTPSAPWTSGGMVSNIYDLKVWCEALYKGTLLSSAVNTQRFDWHTLAGTGGKAKYGLGVANLVGLIGHNGEIEGYNTDMYYLPSKKAVIVCMTNNASALYGRTIYLTKQVVNILYPGEVSW